MSEKKKIENLAKKYHFVKLDVKIPIKLLINGYAEEFEITISDLLFAVLKDKNKVRGAIAEIREIKIDKPHKYNF